LSVAEIYPGIQVLQNSAVPSCRTWPSEPCKKGHICAQMARHVLQQQLVGSATQHLCHPTKLQSSRMLQPQPLSLGKWVPKYKAHPRSPVSLLRCSAAWQERGWHVENPLAVFLPRRGSRQAGGLLGVCTQECHPTSRLQGPGSAELPALQG